MAEGLRKRKVPQKAELFKGQSFLIMAGEGRNAGNPF